MADPARGDLTLALGYANDYVAYLCSASIMTEGGYEPTSWAEYLRCGPFTHELEGLLVSAALELATMSGTVASGFTATLTVAVLTGL